MTHNQSEQKRARRINGEIEQMRELLEMAGRLNGRTDKGSVLEAATVALKELLGGDEGPSLAADHEPTPAPSGIIDYRSVFDNSGVPQAVAAIDGTFLDCNRKFTELTGYTRAEVRSRSIFNLTPAEDLQKTFDIVSDMMSPRAGGGQATGGVQQAEFVKACKFRHGVTNLRVSMSLVRDAAGNPLHFACALLSSAGGGDSLVSGECGLDGLTMPAPRPTVVASQPSASSARPFADMMTSESHSMAQRFPKVMGNGTGGPAPVGILLAGRRPFGQDSQPGPHFSPSDAHSQDFPPPVVSPSMSRLLHHPPASSTSFPAPIAGHAHSSDAAHAGGWPTSRTDGLFMPALGSSSASFRRFTSEGTPTVARYNPHDAMSALSEAADHRLSSRADLQVSAQPQLPNNGIGAGGLSIISDGPALFPGTGSLVSDGVFQDDDFDGTARQVLADDIGRRTQQMTSQRIE
jgi:PAS domain S-box-containing protein